MASPPRPQPPHLITIFVRIVLSFLLPELMPTPIAIAAGTGAAKSAGSAPASAISRSIKRTVLALPDSTATRSSRPARSSSHATEALPCLSRKRRPPTVRSSRTAMNSGCVSFRPSR